jgi:diacylglycerol kinase (ATP)
MMNRHSGFTHPLAACIRHQEGQPDCEGLFRLLVISGLQRLFLGIHPFWGEPGRALYYTAIEQRATGFARALPSILRGKPAAHVNAANGYHSATIDSVSLDFHGSYTLDGELQRVNPPDAPITVACIGRARFLRIH